MEQTTNLNAESSAILTDSGLPREERVDISQHGCLRCCPFVFFIIWCIITLEMTTVTCIFFPPVCVVPFIFFVIGIVMMTKIPFKRAIIINNDSHLLILEKRGIFCCCRPKQRKIRIDEINKVMMNKNIVHYGNTTRITIACTIIYKNGSMEELSDILSGLNEDKYNQILIFYLF